MWIIVAGVAGFLTGLGMGAHMMNMWHRMLRDGMKVKVRND